MAETVLVIPERLSDTLRDEGRHILEALDSKQAKITAAFWIYLEEETWRLCLATPLTDTEGPLFVYKLLQDVLQEISSSSNSEVEIGLMNIAVISPNMLIVQNMKHRYGRIEKEDSRRVRRTDAPYIYHLTID